MDSSSVRDILDKTRALVEEHLSTGSLSSRIQAQDQVQKLVWALEQPRDAIMKLAYGPAVTMALKIALDLNIFSVLAPATSPVPLAELAAAKQADPLLVERVLRVLVAKGIVNEPAPAEYLPTAVAKELTQRPSIGVLESLFCEFIPLFRQTPEFLKLTKYRNPEDPLATALQYTYNFNNMDGFTWLCGNPDALRRFNGFMEGQRTDRPHWADWFPVRERVLDHPDLGPETPLIVDIGANRGHDLIGFRQRFPDVPGKLMLEDLPKVIDEVRDAQDLEAAKVETQVFDFFNEIQPIHGARVYYFKHILHDWSDEKASIIIKNLKPAMRPGFSKIIMEEYILADQNAALLSCVTDMAVMAFCSGLERTRRRWDTLLTENGLRVIKYWVPEGDGLGIIEAELAE
ncbi:hypothetical protein ASPZODRAFT_137320 [Penicilliopsis zonata CBS 506.65]|uniref:Uncharacterized protein n=1 Tax=Penicilliopsis zonata CBS 506.65 TaxID=1073090 RepID=A0A1L9S5J9_9EURO|nr:hypothetical protein ASPZODRAFT_137320 [Penicilliopsis zonata CBS 506.65]OJJ42407.1 hypothetical protein ASPZODRAFT_137320 [Penicilliopsis zonata CBS 506.65]